MDDDDEVLFDALELPPVAANTNDANTKEASYVAHEAVRTKNEPSPPAAAVQTANVKELTDSIEHLKATVASHHASRVEAAAQNTMLQKQLEHQWSVVKHLKQMLKNISDKYTSTQVENRALKVECRDARQQCDSLREQVHKIAEDAETLRRREVERDDIESRFASLENAHRLVLAECDEWKRRANDIAGVADENAELRQTIATTSLEHAIASKRTHHIIKELRRALKQAQDSDQAQQAVSTVAVVKHDIAMDAASRHGSMDAVLQDMATRLEQLLTQNAHLVERVAFTQENVRLLAADLERKRLVIQQLTLQLASAPDERDDVVASAVATAAALEVSASCETLLYVTIKENLLLKKRLGCPAPFAVSWKEPECTSFYRML